MTTGGRYVLMGLARPRASWFADVSRWATAGTIPAEFLKCVSAEEVRARLATGRRWSAVLLDSSLAAVDRDLLAELRDAACAAIVVDDRGEGDRWLAIGAAGVLPAGFDRRHLLELLERVALTVGRPIAVDGRSHEERGPEVSLVVAVCGPGGTGASTAAAATAQGLAATGRATVLVDLARHAEHAALHDVRDVVPGLQELVEAHRNGVPSDDEVRRLTFTIVERDYSLLLGLRRARYWPVLRRRAFLAAFASLQATFDALVCDVTADFENESDAGSADVDERNLAARTAVTRADVVLVVGRPGMKGVHALARVLGELAAAGVPARRIVPVVNTAPRSPRAKAELASTIATLTRPVLGGGQLASPVCLPSRPVDRAFRDGAPLPAPLPRRLAETVLAVADRAGPRSVTSPEPVPVKPGSLGSFADEVG